MTFPGISLIIPAYNAGRYLREAIDSALKQTITPRQIIVVDDGSTDDTLAVARSYGDAVTAIAQLNQGSATARNRGLAEADQPIITFLDADDRLMSHKLERQLQSLCQHPQAMLCICRVCDFWSPDLPQNKRSGQQLVPHFRPGQSTTWLARRELFESVGSFNTSSNFRFTEGSELYSRIESSRAGTVRIEDVLVERRLHATNKTANSAAHLQGLMALMKRRLDLRKESA